MLAHHIEAYHNEYDGHREIIPSEVPTMPMLVYDAGEHMERWRQWVTTGDLSAITIRTLHSVNSAEVPLRWIVNIVETAELVEGMQKIGVRPPGRWETIAPIHINTACNHDIEDADELSDVVEESLETAVRLNKLSHQFLDRFHPTVPKPQLIIDDPQSVTRALEKGRELYPHLPDYVKEELSGMAMKHSREDARDENIAGYLVGHYIAYGRARTDEAPLFPPVKNTLFAVPASEDRFLRAMTDSESAMQTIGEEIVPFSETNSLVMVSSTLTKPHYYTQPGEPLLIDINNPQQFITPNKFARTGLNEIARRDAVRAIERIEHAIGGKQNGHELVRMIRQTLLSA